MPCVEGELYLVKATTPAGREGHGCQGKCGGRFHGVWGRVAEDNELHRICSKCSAKAGKRRAIAPEGAGTGQSKRQKTKEGSKSAPRKRMTTDQKVEILDILEQRVSHKQIADRFGCAEEEEERRRMPVVTARGAEGVPHRPTLNYRLTSASWRGQRRLVGIETPPFTCQKPGWR